MCACVRVLESCHQCNTVIGTTQRSLRRPDYEEPFILVPVLTLFDDARCHLLSWSCANCSRPILWSSACAFCPEDVVSEGAEFEHDKGGRGPAVSLDPGLAQEALSTSAEALSTSAEALSTSAEALSTSAEALSTSAEASTTSPGAEAASRDEPLTLLNEEPEQECVGTVDAAELYPLRQSTPTSEAEPRSPAAPRSESEAFKGASMFAELAVKRSADALSTSAEAFKGVQRGLSTSPGKQGLLDIASLLLTDESQECREFDEKTW